MAGVEAVQATVDGGAAGIAIIGMGCRFPGADGVGRYWDNLTRGIESITELTESELRAAGVDPATLDDPHYVRAASVVAGIENFDAAFFGYSPREARTLDPQHRLFLQTAWHALEDAACEPGTYRGRIGVFAGCSMSGYFDLLRRDPETVAGSDHLQLLIGNDKDYFATRVSHKLDLTGPSLNVQTSCSTSLVAVSVACHAILSGQCDMAVAGGASIKAPDRVGYRHAPDGIYSPDGHTRTFDSEGRGTVFGNGVGAVVLKRLDAALADGDHVYAVIRAAETNNDGSAKSSFAAPSVTGQRDLIVHALATAGIDARTVGFVEAHGTATATGDPIEVGALTAAFAPEPGGPPWCALGSVKSNFGHLDHAAGIAALIKAALAVHHGQIPATLHFVEPNPRLHLTQSPFFVNTELIDWPREGPRRACVSGFGIGGTNAHVVLEQVPSRRALPAGGRSQVLPVSARTAAALAEAESALAAHLAAHPDVRLEDVAATLQTGRRGFGHRRAIVSADAADAARQLATSRPGTVTDLRRTTEVVFLFPGQGSQYGGMTAGLYATEPGFRADVDRCAALLERHLGMDLRSVLYPATPSPQAARAIDPTWLAQPALFVTEYAMARLLLSWGLRPRAMIGHSVGEFVAACIAGVFTLEEAIELVATRGTVMQSCEPGAMLSVALGEEALAAYTAGDTGDTEAIDLAATNAPSLSVVAGPVPLIDALAMRLEAAGVAAGRIHTSHAFHSAMMDPAVGPFTAIVDGIAPAAPAMPFLSNVTGSWITPAQATDSGYWARHMRGTVRFQESVATLLGDVDARCVLVEVGPGTTLSTLVRRHPELGPDRRVVPLGRAAHDATPDRDRLLAGLAALWESGVTIDWDAVHGSDHTRKVPLPGYPFEGRRYWVDPGPEQPEPAPPRRRVDDWFSLLSWRPGIVPSAAPVLGRSSQPAWLVFEDSRRIGAEVSSVIRARGEAVTVVRAGRRFLAGPDGYVVRPGNAADHDALVASLVAGGGVPRRIVHLWSVDRPRRPGGAAGAFAQAQTRGLHSILRLVQGLIRHCHDSNHDITVVTEGAQQVTGSERMRPNTATVLGACRTVPQEYAHLSCRSVDIAVGADRADGADGLAAIAADLVAEASSPVTDAVVAHRGGRRWVQGFEPVALPSRSARPALLRDGGTYLLSGGLGAVGLAVAHQIAVETTSTLILLSRTPLPPRERWRTWQDTHGEDDAVCRRIRAVTAIEDLGSQVVLLSADVGDADALGRALASDPRCHTIDGVVHAAGTISPSAFFGIDEATPQRCADHFRPKIAGMLALEQALAGRAPDFWLLVSSLASVLGGLGYVGYTAANAWLDAYGSAARTRGRRPAWMTVNWDNWDFAGTSGAKGMTGAEGAETFRRLLAHPGAGQVLVSVDDLARKVRDWADPTAMRERAALETPTTYAQPRPDVATTYVAPATDLQRMIAEIVGAVLGVEQVGIHDEFELLGGHSLLATQVVARLRTARIATIPLRRFLEMPTVAQLADHVATL